MLNNLSIDSIACKEEAHPSDNCPQDVLQQYQFFLTAYFRLSSTATATETVIPTMGLLPAPRKPRKHASVEGFDPEK